jgi:hypothetical protein
MTAALIAQRGRGQGVQIRAEVDAAVVVLNSQLLHAALQLILNGGLRALSESWHLPDRDFRTIESSLLTVIGPPTIFGSASLPSLPVTALLGEVSDFAHAPLLFGEALAAGWPWALAMLFFTGLWLGHAYDGGLEFIPERGKQS